MSQTQVSVLPIDTACLPPFTPLDQQVLEEYHNHFFKQGLQPDPARLRELVHRMQGYSNYLNLLQNVWTQGLGFNSWLCHNFPAAEISLGLKTSSSGSCM